MENDIVETGSLTGSFSGTFSGALPKLFTKTLYEKNDNRILRKINKDIADGYSVVDDDSFDEFCDTVYDILWFHGIDADEIHFDRPTTIFEDTE